jgi:drug/metabolite transporter (DMT)-like permease
MENSGHFKGVMYSVVAALMWGVLAIALKISSAELSTMTIVWVRFAIAFVLIFAFHIVKRPFAFSIFRKPPRKLIIASICLGINYYGYMKGLEYTSPAIAQIFIQLGPVLFALAGIIIFKEKINWKHITGFVIVLIGFGIFYHEHLHVMPNQGEYTIGILLLIIGSAAWASYAIYQKELAKTYSTNQLNLFIYGLCTLLFAPFARYSGFETLTFVSWLLVLFLGLNTLIAYGAIALAFKHLEANKVSVIITMNPIITFLIMYVFFITGINWIKPEHFSALSIIGSIMALGGAAFVIIFAGKKKAVEKL